MNLMEPENIACVWSDGLVGKMVCLYFVVIYMYHLYGLTIYLFLIHIIFQPTMMACGMSATFASARYWEKWVPRKVDGAKNAWEHGVSA